MKTYTHTFVISVILALLSVSSAHAAFVSAQVSSATIRPNETSQIKLFLNLDPGETASVFEGVFDLPGLNNIVDVSSTFGGPSWPNKFGNITSNRFFLSLTSDNDNSSSRQVAVLDILAKKTGVFEVIFDDSSFASFDINVSPFLQDLALNNKKGEALARISVVPVPPALVLLFTALGGLSVFRRLNKAARNAGIAFDYCATHPSNRSIVS